MHTIYYSSPKIKQLPNHRLHAQRRKPHAHPGASDAVQTTKIATVTHSIITPVTVTTTISTVLSQHGYRWLRAQHASCICVAESDALTPTVSCQVVTSSAVTHAQMHNAWHDGGVSGISSNGTLKQYDPPTVNLPYICGDTATSTYSNSGIWDDEEPSISSTSQHEVHLHPAGQAYSSDVSGDGPSTTIPAAELDLLALRAAGRDGGATGPVKSATADIIVDLAAPALSTLAAAAAARNSSLSTAEIGQLLTDEPPWFSRSTLSCNASPIHKAEGTATTSSSSNCTFSITTRDLHTRTLKA